MKTAIKINRKKGYKGGGPVTTGSKSTTVEKKTTAGSSNSTANVSESERERIRLSPDKKATYQEVTGTQTKKYPAGSQSAKNEEENRQANVQRNNAQLRLNPSRDNSAEKGSNVNVALKNEGTGTTKKTEAYLENKNAKSVAAAEAEVERKKKEIAVENGDGLKMGGIVGKLKKKAKKKVKGLLDGGEVEDPDAAAANAERNGGNKNERDKKEERKAAVTNGLGTIGASYYASQESSNEGEAAYNASMAGVSKAVPIVGGIIAVGDAVGKPVRKNAEKKDEYGIYKNEKKAKGMAQVGSIMNPFKNITETLADKNATTGAKVRTVMTGGYLFDKKRYEKEQQERKKEKNAALGAQAAVLQDENNRYAQREFSEGGKVEGKGTAKSDSIPARIKKGSFIVPAENAGLAVALRKKILKSSGSKKAKLNGQGVDVKLSNGEHMFNPKEVKDLQKEGIDLNALAPNAEPGNRLKNGGGPEDDRTKKLLAERKKKQEEKATEKRTTEQPFEQRERLRKESLAENKKEALAKKRAERKNIQDQFESALKRNDEGAIQKLEGRMKYLDKQVKDMESEMGVSKSTEKSPPYDKSKNGLVAAMNDSRKDKTLLEKTPVPGVGKVKPSNTAVASKLVTAKAGTVTPKNTVASKESEVKPDAVDEATRLKNMKTDNTIREDSTEEESIDQ
jgi:hypothetical protein